MPSDQRHKMLYLGGGAYRCVNCCRIHSDYLIDACDLYALGNEDLLLGTEGACRCGSDYGTAVYNPFVLEISEVYLIEYMCGACEREAQDDI